MSNILEGLNAEQFSAATHDKGPLLIIAGAGTGKTRVITSRILHLIQELGASPGEILALTFTEKAAREMEERVDMAMPLGYEEVFIRTFHGFCDSVLKESAHEIGLDSTYKLLSQVDASLLIKKNLFKFSLEYYRPLGNPLKFINSLLTHFSRLKDEDILPSKYLEFAQGQIKSADDEAREEAERTLEIATFYNQYQNFIRSQGCMDFGDLIFYTLRLFEKRSSVLKNYQQRFKYILVDEFQDTNFAQSKLVHMLAQGHHNIVVVGDDDQSIYKWRGASLSNILQFEGKYPNTKKVVLMENYRSSQQILDLAYGVIQSNNPYRLEVQEGLNKKLNAQFEGVKPEVIHAGHYLDEVKAVVDRIEELVKSGASYGDCAVLGRTNAALQHFVREMNVRGIPLRTSQVQGFFKSGVLKDIVSLMTFLVNPYDDTALIRLLSFEGFDISNSEVLAVAYESRQKQVPMWKLLRATAEQAQLPGLEAEEFGKAVELLKDILEFSACNSVGMCINEFFVKTEYLSYLSENPTKDNLEIIERIQIFSEIVADYESEHDAQNINEFLEYVRILDESGSISAPSGVADDAVNLMTVHSSKGLEFPNVFVVNLVQSRFPSVNKRDPFMVPEELVDEPLPHEKNIHVMEERRLFYVAATRAKERLYLSYSDKYEGTKKWKPSVFVEECREFGGVTEYEIEKGEKMSVPVDSQVDNVQFGDVEKADFPKKASFSQFSSFERCPQQYRFRYLLRLPSPSSHAANFGSSLHNTLNAFYQKLQQGQNVSLDLLRDLFERYWITSGYQTIAHHNARKKKGWEILEAFYEGNSKPFVVPAYLERAFTLRLDGVDVTGRIDRIDKLEDGSYEVIDYKTGTYKKSSNLDKDLQLSLYALAAKELFEIPVSKLSLYFLEGNEKVSTTRSDEDLVRCRQEVMDLVGKMRQSNFEPEPGFACQFCEYSLICNAAK